MISLRFVALLFLLPWSTMVVRAGAPTDDPNVLPDEDRKLRPSPTDDPNVLPDEDRKLRPASSKNSPAASAASFLRRSLEGPPQGMRQLEGFEPVFDEIDKISGQGNRQKLEEKLNKVVKEYNKDPTSDKTDKAISNFCNMLQKVLNKGDITEQQFTDIKDASFLCGPVPTTTTVSFSK